MRTHIYIATNSKAIKQQKRICAFLITANGSERTVFGAKEIEATRNRVHLVALSAALKHFNNKPCEIVLHSDNAWVLNMIKNPLCLSRWRSDGTLDKGDASGLKDWDLWRDVSEKIQGKTLYFEPGAHEFESWMLTEARSKSPKVG